MRVRRANSDRVTSAAVAALSMAEMSSSSNQKEITRPMPAHIRWALVGISTFTLAACGSDRLVETWTPNPDGTCTYYRHREMPAAMDRERTQTVACPEDLFP